MNHQRSLRAIDAAYLGAGAAAVAGTWSVLLSVHTRFGEAAFAATAAMLTGAFAVSAWGVVSREGGRVAGGLLATVAVCLSPLVVWSLQLVGGRDLHGAMGLPRSVGEWVSRGWLLPELGTVLAGAVMISLVRHPFVAAPMAIAVAAMGAEFSLAVGGVAGEPFVLLAVGVGLVGASHLVDRVAVEDYACSGYLAGLALIELGLSRLVDTRGAAGWSVFGLTNLAIMLLSPFVRRRAFLVVGGLGVAAYAAWLASTVLQDSLAVALAVAAAGVTTLALAFLWERRGRQ